MSLSERTISRGRDGEGDFDGAPSRPGRALRARHWLASGAALLLAGCSTLYFHDERGATRAAEAKNQLTDAAGLKPFDDQVTALTAFSAQEDLAVARFWTVARDRALAAILAAKDQDAVLQRLVDDRLGDLAPAVLNNPAMAAELSQLPDTLSSQGDYEANYGADAEANLKNYRLLMPGDPRTCKELENLDAAAIRTLRGSGSVAERALMTAARSCVQARGARQAIADGRAKIVALGGALGDAYADVEAAQSATGGSLSERAQALDAQIKAAEDLAKTGDAATLETFRQSIADALKGPSKVIKALGWKEAQTQVDGILRALVCVAPTAGATEAERAAAKCDAIETGSTTERAEANFKLLQALAVLADTRSPKYKAAQWLLAARAIITAERTNAQLELDLAQAKTQVSRQRLSFLLNEAATLASIEALYSGRAGPGCRGSRLGCGFAAYTGSWNEGRIPAEVLRYHDLQSERLYAVRRSRAAAEKQRALALAGAGALNDRYAGGIQPTLAAQLLFDAGIFAAQMGN